MVGSLPDRTCSGVLYSASFINGALLNTSHAIFIAYGQSVVETVFGHLWLACNNIARAVSWSSLIRLFAIPFWWWAFTPANVSLCWFSLQQLTHLFAFYIPLLAWYALTDTPYNWRRCSKLVFLQSFLQLLPFFEDKYIQNRKPDRQISLHIYTVY